MKYASLVLALLLVSSAVFAQQDTAYHRKVYASINDNLKALKKVRCSHTDSDLEFALEAYVKGSDIVRIDSSVPGEDGDGSEEYYFENGKVLFAFRYYHAMSAEADAKKQLVEDRFYFADGKMFKWIGTDKKLVDSAGEDFKLEEERIVANSSSFLAAVETKLAPADKVLTLKGTFKGIEQGDYGHWLMADSAGKEFSFFILQADESVDKVLEKPESFTGKTCTIRWKNSKEDIPEAGGKIDVEQILSVEWSE
ncbi:MAG: hypothetical protein JNJ83_22190 [Verrucomicrobiaceae bacterium]|nr:hypothetical protein [Verrucomicrobiaceae bacterium]